MKEGDKYDFPVQQNAQTWMDFTCIFEYSNTHLEPCLLLLLKAFIKEVFTSYSVRASNIYIYLHF